MNEDEVLSEPPGLTQIVSDQDDLRPVVTGQLQAGLDRQRRRWIEIGRRFVQKQDLGSKTQRAGKRQSLLLPGGKNPRRPLGEVPKTGATQCLERLLASASARLTAHPQNVPNIRQGRTSKKYRPLKHHGLTLANFPIGRPSGEADRSGGGLDKPMQQA